MCWHKFKLQDHKVGFQFPYRQLILFDLWKPISSSYQSLDQEFGNNLERITREQPVIILWSIVLHSKSDEMIHGRSGLLSSSCWRMSSGTVWRPPYITPLQPIADTAAISPINITP